jgi:CRISPR/Cas system-associated exonuclease Cas4 (RecB family)
MPPRIYKKSTWGLYDPRSSEPHRISRSKIELFGQCPQCFYLDQRIGVKRPEFPAFSLNNAVDELLKREFDAHRAKGEPHPMMTEAGIDAVPYNDPRMDAWRDALKQGVQYLHAKTNFLVRGGVDDLWVRPNGEVIVVDYKATSKKEDVTLDGYWQQSYKRQVEIYQWLLRHNDVQVSPTAYFVYVNGNSDAERFDGKLEFDIKIIPYEGDDAWVEPTLENIHLCLQSDQPPAPNQYCDYCLYRRAAGEELLARKLKNKTPAKPAPKTGDLGI